MGLQSPVAHGVTVTVSTAADLTSAVLNPANAGAQIVIAAGNYRLTIPLELQEGMILSGPNTYLLDANGVPQPRPGYKDSETFADPANEAILDGSHLPVTPQSLGGSPGVVIAGRSNTISGVTIIGNTGVSAAVDVRDVSAIGGAHIVVVGCVLEGIRRGIRMFSTGAASPFFGVFDQTVSTALVQGNVIRDNTQVYGFGIQIVHGGVVGAEWDVDVRSNRVYGNNVGLFTTALASQGSSIQLHSSNNLYVQNVLGYEGVGGNDFGIGAAVANNTLLQSMGDVIANNVGEGGVIAVAGDGFTAAFANSVTGNTLGLQFFNTVFTTGSGLENGSLNKRNLVRSDLVVVGATAPAESSTGPGNTISLLIRHAQSDGAPGAFVAQNTTFPDPGGSNMVLIPGSDVAIERTNNGVPPPIFLP